MAPMTSLPVDLDDVTDEDIDKSRVVELDVCIADVTVDGTKVDDLVAVADCIMSLCQSVR